jgi:hypothetical protein
LAKCRSETPVARASALRVNPRRVRKAFARSPSAARNGSLGSSRISLAAVLLAPTDRSAGVFSLGPRGAVRPAAVGEDDMVFDKVRAHP